MASGVKPLSAEFDHGYLRFSPLKSLGDEFWVACQPRINATRSTITVQRKAVLISDKDISSCLRMRLKALPWQKNIVKIVTLYSYFHKKLEEAVKVAAKIMQPIKQLSSEDIHRLAGAITHVLVFKKIKNEEDVHVSKSVFETARGFYLFPNQAEPKKSKVYLNLGKSEPILMANEKRRVSVEVVSGKLYHKVSRKNFNEKQAETEIEVLGRLEGEAGIVHTRDTTIYDNTKLVLYQEKSDSKLVDREFIQTVSFSAILKIVGQLLNGLEKMSKLGVHGNICHKTVEVRSLNHEVKAWITGFGGFVYLQSKGNRGISVGKHDVIMDPKDKPLQKKRKKVAIPKTERKSAASPNPKFRVARGTHKRSLDKAPTREPSSPRLIFPRKESLKSQFKLARKNEERPPKLAKASLMNRSKSPNVSSARAAKRPHHPLRANSPNRSKSPISPSAKSGKRPPHPLRASSPNRSKSPISPSARSGRATSPLRVHSPSRSEGSLSPTMIFKRVTDREFPGGPVFLKPVLLTEVLEEPKNEPPSDEQLKKKDVCDLGAVLRDFFNMKKEWEKSGEEIKRIESDSEEMNQKRLDRIGYLIDQMTDPDEGFDAREAYSYFKKAFGIH